MADLISLVLWAYCTSKHPSTQAMSFSLIYGAEAMVLIEIMAPLACLALASKDSDSPDSAHDIEALEEKKEDAESKWSTYQSQISKAYNKLVKPRILKVSDLVLKAGHVKKGSNASKFAPKWEGPYIIREAYDST